MTPDDGVVELGSLPTDASDGFTDGSQLAQQYARLRSQLDTMELRIRKSDERRKALLHILQDSHRSKLRLEASRKAMIHIMGDLRDTTAEMEQREQELRQTQSLAARRTDRP